MKEIKVLATSLLGLSNRRPAARSAGRSGGSCCKLYPRLVLFLTVTGVIVFVSSGTASAHIDSLVPSQWTAGGPAITLRLLGTDFDDSDTGRVLFNGTRVAATLISDRELQATISATLLVSPEIVEVRLEGFNFQYFTVNPPPTITTESPLPEAVVGQPYSQTLMNSGGTAPFTWSGTVPTGFGLSLSPDALISGAPTAPASNLKIAVTVTDAAGVMARKEFSLTINHCSYGVSPTSQSFPSGGGSGSVSVRATSQPTVVCNWTAVSNEPWITITSGGSGTGNGTVNYSIAGSSQARAGSLTIGSATVNVYQGFPDCPPSTISISHESALFKPEAGQGIGLYVTAPDDCLWVGVSSKPWIQIHSAYSTPQSGSGTLPYELQMNSGFWRQGHITINGGVMHHVFQNPGGCALDLVCGMFPSRCFTSDPSIVMSQSRSFRDEVLAKTPRGQRYTQLYYKFSTEAVGIMMLNPMLILRSGEVLERYRPLLDSMIKGERIALSLGDLEEIDNFLNSFAAKGSAELRETLKGLCEDLRDPQVQTEFNISITDGPKRELPAQDAVQTVKQTGLMVAPIGLLLFCFPVVRRRRKKAEADLKRLISVTIALGLVSGQWSQVSAQTTNDGQWSVVSAQSKNSGQAKNGAQMSNRGPTKSSGQLSPTTAQRLPVIFERNQGQIDPQVKFTSRGQGYNLYLTPSEAVMSLRSQNTGDWREKTGDRRRKTEDTRQKRRIPALTTHHWPLTTAPPLTTATDFLRMKMVGGNPDPKITGIDELSAKTNYYLGRDPAKWRAGVPAYTRVKYESVYPGIDMIYYGKEGELEYDFIVAPGANPAQIRVGFGGVEKLELDAEGDLVLRTPAGEVRQRKPVVYQEVNGARREVLGGYTLNRTQIVAFEIGDYDRSRPLIIDPVLAYSTYLGAAGNEEGNSIAVDSAGNVYVTGFTDSINFPLTDASQPNLGGGQQDAFVVKLDPSGTRVVYSTYLGGNGQDNGTSIAVGQTGDAYITGFTDSTNFPVRNALQETKRGDFSAFVLKLGPTGTVLNSTLFGGSTSDYGSSIAVDSAGNIYAAGIASSSDLPMTNALQSTHGGLVDMFAAKIDPSGARIIYSTYLGGSGIEGASSIAVDQTGNLYVTGLTSSPDFRTVNAQQAAHGGGLFDAFVAKLNPAGTQIIYSTFLGGGGEDRAFRIAVDSSGSAYVTGDTDSNNLPLASASQPVKGGSADAFVTKLNPSGNQLVYSTYLGGSGIDGGTAIAVDTGGRAYVTGFTASTNFPTANSVQQVFGGGFDGFITKLSLSGSALEYSTYLGGSGIDSGFGIATDAAGNAYVMGVTDSSNFPIAAPLQSMYGGGTADLFVARVTTGPRIGGATVEGKKLFVSGSGFDRGAKILIDGVEQKTANDNQDPSVALIGKKAGKKVKRGQTVTLQVRNSDGALSNEFRFTRT